MKTIPFILLSTVFLVQLADAANVLSPSVLGNTSSTGPFLLPPSQAPDIRYQQVYGASDFAQVGVGLFQITEIRFDPAGSGVTYNLPNLQINLSTTSRNPDGLSPLFADNVGADDTVVQSGPLVFSGLPTFGINIPLQTPFLYDSRNGNLLMDVRNYQTVPPHFMIDFLSAEDTLGDTVSSVAGAVNATSGGTGTVGLRTRFTVTLIPEPSTGAILILGVMTFGFVLSKKAKSETKNVT